MSEASRDTEMSSSEISHSTCGGGSTHGHKQFSVRHCVTVRCSPNLVHEFMCCGVVHSGEGGGSLTVQRKDTEKQATPWLEHNLLGEEEKAIASLWLPAKQWKPEWPENKETNSPFLFGSVLSIQPVLGVRNEGEEKKVQAYRVAPSRRGHRLYR